MSYIPQFAKGTSTKIKSAIEAGIISYPAYVFETDTRRLDFIDSDNSINPICSPSDIATVSTLPDPENASKDVIYIKDDKVYTFDGEGFHCQTIDGTALEAKIDNIDDILGEELINKSVTLPEYIKQYASGSSATIEWGEF